MLQVLHKVKSGAGWRLDGVLAPLGAMLILMAPAIWNGFPLLQYDTGGYIARWYEGTLEVSRSTVYGLFLNLLAWPDFWPAIIIQTVLSVWVLALIVRTQGFGKRPSVLLSIIVALSILTALPWITDVLLTDIFASLSVLALSMLLTRNDALKAWERTALFLLVAFSAATHSATLMVLLALVAAALVAALVDRSIVTLAAVAKGASAIVLGAAMLVCANYAISGRIAWTPGGSAIVFGRMLQAGIVTQYLNDHCPDPTLKLCAYRDQLPATADEFFWGKSVFDQLGRFEGLDDEMRKIEFECLKQYPWFELKAAFIATAEQLVTVATGYGIRTELLHTYAMIRQHASGAVPAMLAAREQKGEIDFTLVNRLQVPVALASMALLLGFLAWEVKCGRKDELVLLSATVLLALLANAAACGALSNPNDRYGSRMAWLALLPLLLACARGFARRRHATEIGNQLPLSVT